MVSEALESVRPLFDQKGVALTLEAPNGRMTMFFDQGRMTQVVLNLLTNALKFTDSEGRVAMRVSPNGQGVRVEVEDDGIGIPAKANEVVFSRFYQLDTDHDSRTIGGAGLGLFICKMIVEDGHRGRIWVEPNRARGTLIVFTLPLAATAQLRLDAKIDAAVLSSA